MRSLHLGRNAIMPFMLVILIVLATIAAWRPAEAAQAGRYEGDAVVDWKSIPGDVTFEVPLDLTKLAPDISKVMVTCSMTSDAFPMRKGKGAPVKQPRGAQVELPVSAGQLVTTARVVIPVTVDSFMDPTMAMPKDPTGKSVDYQCDIMGFSTKGGGWQQFIDKITEPKNTNTSFHLTPFPAPITGRFVW